MKNRLKRKNSYNDASCSSHNHPTTREVEPKKEHPWTFSAGNIKIAPIFLRRSVTKHGTNGIIGQQKVNFEIERVQQVKSHQDAKLSCDRAHRGGRSRGPLPLPDVTRCLEEIQTPNPAFPARAVFSKLQQKSSAYCSAQHVQTIQTSSSPKNQPECGSPERVPKRPRLGLSADSAAAVGDCPAPAQGAVERAARSLLQPRSSRLSRTRRLKQLKGSGVTTKSDTSTKFLNYSNCCSQLDKTFDDPRGDVILEDLLWTDKYSPQHSSEVIGNAASVKKLQSWLQKWKQRAVCDKTSAQENKGGENSSDVWDCGDFQGESEAEGNGGRPLCNTLLISGPPGVGKTASVYACAQELGFKVFEVNCSSLRSGSHVLAQLKEATQSHLVEIPGKGSMKPAYFNNYSTAQKRENLPGKRLSPKNVCTTSKKKAAQKLGRSGLSQKPSQAAVTLANFFKVKAKADRLSPPRKPDNRTAGCSSSDPDQNTSCRKTPTSLILFEEVDVSFDDDVGFLAAVKTFMLTTKRPVVLTTNDPLFRLRFNCPLEEITFKVPAKANVCSYLQLVALAEGTRLKFSDAHDLVRLSGGDVRRCLLQLQLWASSGGGRPPHQTSRHDSSDTDEQLKNEDRGRSDRYAGCAAAMLGLPSITPDHLLDLIKSRAGSEVESTELLQLLAVSWRQGVSLLYSNLRLLPLPQDARASVQGEKLRKPSADSGNQLGTRAAPVRRSSKLSRRRRNPLVDTPSSCSGTERRSAEGRSSWSGGTERTTAACLDALTDFLDHMSFLDATAPPVSGPCGPETFVWTGAETHDGMLDEMRDEEEDRSWSQSQERLLDIRAAVEGLSFRRCLKGVCDALGGNQKVQQEVRGESCRRPAEGLTSPSSSERNLNFSLEPTSVTSGYQLSRTLLSRKPFGHLGNRAAVTIDYMPTLRFMCRLRKSRQQEDQPDGFLHYLTDTHLGLSESTVQRLAKDFCGNSLETIHTPSVPSASK